MHVVGGLVGKFSMDHDTRPAILLNAYKAFGGAVATDLTATSALATPPSTKSTSSLAPPGYTKPVATASRSPKTPSHSRNIKALPAQDKTTKAKGVSTSKETISDSEDELRQTLPNASIFNDSSVETSSTLYNAPSFEDGVLGAGGLEDEVDVTAKNTKLTS